MVIRDILSYGVNVDKVFSKTPVMSYLMKSYVNSYNPLYLIYLVLSSLIGFASSVTGKKPILIPS